MEQRSLAATSSYNWPVEDSYGSQDWAEMQMSTLFGSSITLFQNIQQGICFDFEHYFQQMPFSHPQESLQWNSNCSLKGIFISPQKNGILTFWSQEGIKKKKKATRSKYKLFVLIVSVLHTFLICREDDFYCWQNQNTNIHQLFDKFSNRPFYVFPHESLSKVVVSISKFILFHNNASCRFYLALNSHLPPSWQDMGCDHTYHTEQYSLLEPLPTTSYLYLEKSALKKKSRTWSQKSWFN